MRVVLQSLMFAVVSVFSVVLSFPASAAPAVAIEAAFTPYEDAAGLIARRIGEARETVQVQAYLFTSRPVANALLAARKRGIAVEVIGDAAQHATGGLPVLKALDRAGATVYLNGAWAAAHDKVVIVDGKGEHPVVITGSFNFTSSAQARNAENVVAIAGDRALAARYVAHFERQRSLATRWP